MTYTEQGAQAHRHALAISRRMVAAQTGATGLRLLAGEVGEYRRKRPLWMRLAVMAWQFMAVASVCVLAIAIVGG